jgi:hypothetical protein
MTLSIIIAVLNSHEIFRRQCLHWRTLGLPDSVEFLIMDDGSDPPLDYPAEPIRNFTIHPTHDTRPWTVELARNQGARLAASDLLLMTDLDYIIPRDAIDSALTLTEDKMRFKRQFGVLQPDGSFTQDLDVLRTYGLSEQRILERGTRLAPHPNNFVMRKEAFWRIGGYREDLVDRPYPNKGDTYFKRAWAQAYERGELTLRDSRPTLYMFPSGQWCGDVDADPLGLFHTLTRKTPNNHWYTHQRYAP